MRFLAGALLMAAASLSQAQVSQAIAGQLCQAASEDSAFGVLVDGFIERDEIALTGGEQLLSVQCADGQSVLSRMVLARQAENLEYAVIDMGLSLSETRVELNGKTLVLAEAMKVLAEQGDAETRRFVDAYLSDLADEDFNPNLLLSLK